MRCTVLTAALWFMLDCSQPPPKRLAENAEALGAAKPSTSALRGDELNVALHERKGRDDVAIIAVQNRPLTREQVRAWVQQTVGSAKQPTVDIYSSQEAYAACVRNKFQALRGQGDPADRLKCSGGTVTWMDQAEPRVLYWGKAAPPPE
jgi:hypothetical protein